MVFFFGKMGYNFDNFTACLHVSQDKWSVKISNEVTIGSKTPGETLVSLIMSSTLMSSYMILLLNDVFYAVTFYMGLFAFMTELWSIARTR